MARNANTVDVTRAACRAAGCDVDGPGVIAKTRSHVTFRITGAMRRVIATERPTDRYMAGGMAYMQSRGGNGHGPNIRWALAPSACDAAAGRAIGATAAAAGVRPAIAPRIAPRGTTVADAGHGPIA